MLAHSVVLAALLGEEVGGLAISRSGGRRGGVIWAIESLHRVSFLVGSHDDLFLSNWAAIA
jgi:hypothetical protein